MLALCGGDADGMIRSYLSRRDPDLDGFQGIEVGTQHGHDLCWQVPAGFAAFGIGGDVTPFNSEVTWQSRSSLAGPGQSQGADPGQGGTDVPAEAVPAVSADLLC